VDSVAAWAASGGLETKGDATLFTTLIETLSTTQTETLVAVLAQAPNPAPVAPPGMESVAEQFIGWGKWILIVAGVLGMFICAGMMIIGRRNRSATAVDGAAGVPWVLGGLFLGAVAASLVGAVAL
jgi:hypothetical protein